MWQQWAERWREGRRNPAQRRYLARFTGLILAYAGTLMGTSAAIRGSQPSGATLFFLSVLPAIPLVATIAVMGLYLREERDEFVRVRLVTAMVGGIGLLLAFTTVWGFLELHGVVAHFPTFLAFPLFCGAFGLVQGGMGIADRLR